MMLLSQPIRIRADTFPTPFRRRPTMDVVVDKVEHLRQAAAEMFDYTGVLRRGPDSGERMGERKG